MAREKLSPAERMFGIMHRLAGTSLVEGILIGWVATQPEIEPRPPVGFLDDAQAAAELARIQRNRARESAREADLILRLAELRPDTDDPPPGMPGARSRSARRTDPEFPGVSESFPDEVAHVINLGRRTAAFRARRAFTWQEQLPGTFAALHRGQLDERRAGVLADVLQYTRPELSQAVESQVLGEAAELPWLRCAPAPSLCWPSSTPPRSGSGTRRRSGPPTCAAIGRATEWPPWPAT